MCGKSCIAKVASMAVLKVGFNMLDILKHFVGKPDQELTDHCFTFYSFNT